MRALCFGLLLAVLSIQQAEAWGQDGHSTIAEIAQREISDNTRAIVDRLLDHGSLAAVASWADDVKYSYRPETNPWHFVDIPIGRSRYDPEQDCKDNICLVAVLDQLKKDMRCARGQDAQRDALRFAVHLVGDVTQPLHTVLEQQGGNQVTVKINFCGLKQQGQPCHPPGNTMNFHALWDDGLIDATVYDWGAYVRRLYGFDGWLQSREAKQPDPGGDTVVGWVNDSHAQAPIIWTQMLPADDVIDQKYYDAALKIVDRQLGLGGLRLARFLEEAYAANACTMSLPEQGR